MDGPDPALDESTGTYPLLSGAAGFAFRPEEDEAAAPVDDEPPTEEIPLVLVQPAAPGGIAPTKLQYPSRPRATMLIGAAVLLVGSALLVVGLSSGRSDKTNSAPPPPPGPAFRAGTVDLAARVGELKLTLGRTQRGPVEVSGPATAAAAIDGTQVRVTAGENSTPLDVRLDERIAWTIRMSGGVHTATFALAHGTVEEIDLSGGADTVSLALPRIDQALPIRMSGGVREWSIVTANEVPVRVHVQSGAAEVSLYGKRQDGIGQGTTLTAGTGPGLDITADAGFHTLTVSAP